MHADRFASCTIDNISDTTYQVKIHKLFKINIIIIIMNRLYNYVGF